jgi:alpha-glutamyl/putrescinyl thymine pyrophosphorylase clade 1
MTRDLPEKVADAAGLREVYELLLGLPSLGPFLAYQYAVDLGYSAVTRADESQLVVAGPGRWTGSPSASPIRGACRRLMSSRGCGTRPAGTSSGWGLSSLTCGAGGRR